MMRMKNKLNLLLLLTVIMAVLLSGCSLAKEESDADAKFKEDLLIGALVDVVQDDEWVETERQMEGKVIRGDDNRVQGLEFPGFDGRYFAYYIDEDEDGKTHVVTGDDAIVTTGSATNVNEEGTTEEMSGTLSFLLGKDEDDQPIFNMHPIYQRADGSVYVENTANSALGSMYGDMTLSLSSSTTLTTNGKKESYGSTVKLTFHGMNWPVFYTILQYSDDDQLLKKETYEPEELPEELMADKGMAYVVVTMETTDAEGKKVMERTLYEKEEDGPITIKAWKKSDSPILDANFIDLQ